MKIILTTISLLFISVFSGIVYGQSGDTLFYENFDDNRFGWLLGTTSTRSIHMADGKLHVKYTQKKSRYGVYTFNTQINTDTFRLTVKLLPDSLRRGGIIFNCSRDKKNNLSSYCGFLRDNKSYYAYEYVYSFAKFYPFGNKRKEINLQSPVTFEIEVQGRIARFLANGEYLFSYKLLKNATLNEFGWVCAGSGSFALEEILIVK